MLLIAGLPGAGKSHFCRWLAAECEFAYIETDSDPVIDALAARNLRVVVAAASELKDRGPNVALEWGFRPTFLPQVRAVVDIGFDPWWFGGNEAAARRSYSTAFGVSPEQRVPSRRNSPRSSWRGQTSPRYSTGTSSLPWTLDRRTRRQKRYTESCALKGRSKIVERSRQSAERLGSSVVLRGVGSRRDSEIFVVQL